MQAKKYFVIEDDVAQLFLYGEVGAWYDGLTAMDVVRQIHALHEQGVKTCHVRINSGGGYIYDGLAIVNVLRNPPAGMKIHTWNDGSCHSMAGDIWLAPPKECRHMAKNASMLIHAPSIGTSKPMTKRAALEMAAMLEKFEEAAVLSMAESTGMTEEVVRTQFYDGGEHLLTHADCLQHGFLEDTGEAYMAEKPTKSGDGLWKTLKKFFKPNSETIDNQPLMKKNDILMAVKSGAISREEVEAVLVEIKDAAPMTAADVRLQIEKAIAHERAQWQAEQAATTTAAPMAATPMSPTEAANDPMPAQKRDESRVNNLWGSVRDVTSL
jgi:ATP-dependent protease ClpP protease subunit